MRAALIVNPVGPEAEENLVRILSLAAEAVAQGAGLLVLPEAAVTGLINNDDPTHDLALGEVIPESPTCVRGGEGHVRTDGTVTERLAGFCREHGCWLCFGVLEREGEALYDSAVLLDSSGAIRLKYRRMHSGWHGPKADPAIYREGTQFAAVETPFGRVGLLICGDLFDDEIVAQASKADLDLLLFPFARSSSDGGCDQARWDAEEMAAYAARVVRVGAPTLLVNYLALPSLPDDGSFGGAFYVSGEGEVRDCLPLGRPGILLVETP